MARLTQAAFLVGALCLLSLPAIVFSQRVPKFQVQGQIFCDVCRANFINKFSVPMPGAKVMLECKNEESGKTTYSLDGVTDAMGFYHLQAEGDHKDELCEVTLVKSGRADCDELPVEGTKTMAAEVTLTSHNGFHETMRHANPLSFNAKKALPMCAELFKELDDENNAAQ